MRYDMTIKWTIHLILMEYMYIYIYTEYQWDTNRIQTWINVIKSHFMEIPPHEMGQTYYTGNGVIKHGIRSDG